MFLVYLLVLWTLTGGNQLSVNVDGNHNNKFFKYCKKIVVMFMLMEPELYIIKII
jgi:hypothetical protein